MNWSKSTEALPAFYKECIVYPRIGDYCLTAQLDSAGWYYLEYDQWGVSQIRTDIITHWMYVPEDPKD